MELPEGGMHARVPVPLEPLLRALRKRRDEKKQMEGLCSRHAMQTYNNASKAEKKRLDQQFDKEVKKRLGPKATAELLWLERVYRESSTPDDDGFCWLVETYRKPKGFGRLTASFPSLQQSPSEVLKEVFHALLHDWDIVSCHYFLTEAVLRGLIKLDSETMERLTPTILFYNAACYEDVTTGRGKERNPFLKPIAEWYGVSVGETKVGCLIVLNQGTLKPE